MFPKRASSSRRSLLQAVSPSHICWAGVVTGTALFSASLAHADEFWQGDTSTDWNDAANWTNDALPAGQWTVVNSGSPHTATISDDSDFTPSDIGIGKGSGQTGRLDHTAGVAATGSGNWMWVGTESGNGTYNLADTSGSGGTLTGFATGSGTMNAQSNLLIGATGGTGVVNVNTSNALNVAGSLRIADFNNNSTGTLNLDAGSVNVGSHIQLGKVSGGSGTINVSGGSLVGNGELRVGYSGGTGTVNLSGGSISTNGWSTFGGSGSTAYLNLSGGTFTVQKDALIIGDNGTGALAQTGGDLVVHGELMLGQGSGNGTFTLSDGTTTTNRWVSVGRDGGSAVVNMSGGTWNHNAGSEHLVIGATGTGTVNLSGGLLNVPTAVLEVAEWGNGTLNLTDSGEVRAGHVRIGINAGATGNLNLNGGTLRTHRISGFDRAGDPGAGSSTARFNGSQIIATADDASFITALDSAEIQSGGLKVDSNGFALASDQVFTGTGDITKSGAGSLALDGNSTFAGDITVSAGALYVNGVLSGTSTTTVDSAALIGGNGSLAGLVSVNGTVAPGLSVGNLSAGSMTIGASGSYAAEIDGLGVNDRLLVTNSLTIEGTIRVFLNYAASAGDSFDLADFASFSGSPVFDFSNATLESGLSWDTSGFAADGAITVVPEPHAAMLGLLGTLGLLARRRRP